MSLVKITKKMFREYLNSQEYQNWSNGRYHQIKRKYGDYLYSQDRIMFNVNYNAWVEERQKNG